MQSRPTLNDITVDLMRSSLRQTSRAVHSKGDAPAGRPNARGELNATTANAFSTKYTMNLYAEDAPRSRQICSARRASIDQATAYAAASHWIPHCPILQMSHCIVIAPTPSRICTCAQISAGYAAPQKDARAAKNPAGSARSAVLTVIVHPSSGPA